MGRIAFQDFAKTVFANSCYAACISAYFGGKSDYIDIMQDILTGIEKGFIEGEDCYVSKPCEYVNLVSSSLDKNWCKDVLKMKINDISDIPEHTVIAEMKNSKGNTHFIICKRNGDKVVTVFDPSNPNTDRKFVSYREFISR